MNTLVIDAVGEASPGIVLDSAKNIFEITGWSYPEDAATFFDPVFTWLSEYAKEPNADTTFHFNFHYFNTASAKQIFKIISLLEAIASKSKTTIHWHYDKDDEDMLNVGQRFSKMSTVPFQFIAK